MNSTTAAQPLAQLHAISKIFFTEDLETHALSEIDLDIHNGEFLSIAGPSGCGQPSCPSSACWTRPRKGHTRSESGL